MPRWGHLDIGENVGAAKNYNPMPIVQEYAQNLAEKKATHDREVAMLGEELAKSYDPNGLRNDADRQQLLKMYGETRDNAIAAENEKDPTKKALALAEVRQQMNNLEGYTAGSKQQGIFERQIALEHLKNPYLLDDNSANQLQSQLSKPWNDNSVIRNAAGFERGVDPAKIDDMLQKHFNNVLKDSPVIYDNGVMSKPKTVLGKKIATITQNRVVPFQDAYESTLNLASSNKDYQKYLHDKYPELPTLAARVKQDMDNRGWGNGFYDKPKVRNVEGYKPEQPVRPSFKDEIFYKEHGYYPDGTEGSKQSNSETYRQQAVQNILAAKQGKDQPTIVPELEQVKQQVAADQTFDHSKPFDYGWNKKGELVVSIPAKQKLVRIANTDDNGFHEEWQTTIPARRETISGPGADVKLNEILNNVTGEKVDISALETPGGKKHVGGQKQVQPKDPKNYTREEYELLKSGDHYWRNGREYIKK